jgi:hypothetical protein
MPLQGYLGLAIVTLIAGLIYTSCLVIYRLFFSPIAKFPGPWLAAVTHYYEFYYNWWLQGKYIYKIEELHEKYGMQFNRLPIAALLNFDRAHYSNQS